MNELKILCPFCNAPWTAHMLTELYSSQWCDTCGYGSEPYGTITVVCDNCNKVVYKKEVD